MRKWKRWLKKRHHSAESVDGSYNGVGYDNDERRCSLPGRAPSQPSSPSSVARLINPKGGKRKSNSLKSSPWHPAVSTVPGQQPDPGRRRTPPEVSGVIHEVPTRWRAASGSSAQHSRHSSLTDEPLINEVIHEVPGSVENDVALHGNHRRHVSDTCGQTQEARGVKNLGKKVEPVSYPGGVRGAKVMAREHRFHAHDDIMPLVEDWYDSWNLLGQTPVTDPGNVPSSEFVLDAKGGRGSGDNEVRRRTASLSTPHRASDVQVDPAQSAILFRDARGLPAAAPFLAFYSYQTLKNDEAQIFVKFFGFHKCYDLIPTSAKLVVFDTQLLVKKAFFALVYNGVRAAPLWDSQKQRFVGMLTITDFIRILAMNYKSPSLEMEELEEHRLQTWRNVLKDVKELIYIEPNASLYQAIKSLIHNKIHRLPVIDTETGNVLYILTHKRILRFLFLYINDLPESSVLDQSVFDLNIGTYNDIEVAYEDTPIIEALHKFVNKRISALPIVDKQHRLIDIYAKFDVINLAAEKTYSNLDVSLKDANKHRNEWFEGVHKCTKKDSLYEVMDKIVKAEVHRLVIVDEENVVCGMISLSDILNYLVLKPGGDDLTKKTIKETMKTDARTSEQDDIFGAGDPPPLLVTSPDDDQPPLLVTPPEQRSAQSSTQSLYQVGHHETGSLDSVDGREKCGDDVVLTIPQQQQQNVVDKDVIAIPQVSVSVLPQDNLEEDGKDTTTTTSIEKTHEMVDTLALVDSGPDTSTSSTPDPLTSQSPCPTTLFNKPTSAPQPQTDDPDIRQIDIEDGVEDDKDAAADLCQPDAPSSISSAKEFGKSDSMDSAFEATEEVDDEVEHTEEEGEERRVHIQIVDASPAPEALNIDRVVSCDKLSGEKLTCDMTATESVSLQQTVQ